MTTWAQRLAVDADAGPGRVCCLPDLFLDHLVPLGPREEAVEAVADVARRGGGNLETGAQSAEVGGNAANMARALARLGVDASLVGPTDAEGLRRARDVLGADDVDVEGLRDVGRCARTVALEMGAGEGEGANVMLSDPGPLDGYGPGDLEAGDEERIRRADVVAVANWAKTRPGGTALLEAAGEIAAESGTSVYLDTSDPATRPAEEVEALVAAEGVLEGVDVWGMNEHEARTYARAAGAADPDLGEAAALLAERTGGRVDVHRADEAVTRGGQAAEAPAFDVAVDRRTGAGDAWNAGNVLADLLGLPAGDRLQVAHAVAALALRGGEPPTRREAAAFLDERAP
jgi:sugar/nucleoside kinase (ribokinase family)